MPDGKRGESLQIGERGERIAFFDNLRGVLILWVVIGHLVANVSPYTHSRLLVAVFDWVWTFHIPTFVFISGLFAKGMLKKGKRFPLERVLTFFLLFLSMGVLLYLMQAALSGSPVTIKLLSNVLITKKAHWYLLAMALYTLSVPLLARVKASAALAFTFIVAISWGLWVNDALFLSLGRVLTFAPFFVCAFYLKASRVKKLKEALANFEFYKRIGMFLIAVLIPMVLFLILYHGAYTYSKTIYALCGATQTYAALATQLHGSIAAPLLARVVYYPVVGAMILCLLVLVPLARLPFLNRAGEASLQIYILHVFIYYAMGGLGINEMMMKQLHLWVISPFVFAPIIVYLLSLPRSPMRGYRVLTDWCKHMFLNHQKQ